MILLVRNGEPTVTINGSFTVIKSLANGLQRAIAQLEKAMSHEIMTVDEISAKLTENMQKDQK